MTSSFIPVPFYCEENVWRLCQLPNFFEPGGAAQEAPPSPAYAVFVSNAKRTVGLLQQKVSTRPNGFILWDYHVFAVSGNGAAALVWDFDSRLPFPCPLGDYLAAVFPSSLPEEFAPRFRLVPAAEYAGLLVSDRSHMRDASGNFLKPPPPWPCPGEGSARPNNLLRFVDLDDTFAGEILGLEELHERVLEKYLGLPESGRRV